MSGSEPPRASNPPPSVQRCPRCGGACAARPRLRVRNPFLAKKSTPELLTCEDCGLDFEEPSSAADGSRDSGRDSGRSPWSKSE